MIFNPNPAKLKNNSNEGTRNNQIAHAAHKNDEVFISNRKLSNNTVVCLKCNVWLTTKTKWKKDVGSQQLLSLGDLVPTIPKDYMLRLN